MKHRVFCCLFIHILCCIPARADFCWTTFETDTADASAIFIGKAVNHIPGNFRAKGQAAYDQYNFVIEKSFKGLESYQSIISIITPFGGCCGHFRTDSTYLVFAYNNGGHSSFYFTNDCSMTALFSEAGDLLSRLGKPVIHQQPQDADLDHLLMIRNMAEADSIKKEFLSLTLLYQTVEWRSILYKLTTIALLVILLIFTYLRITRK